MRRLVVRIFRIVTVLFLVSGGPRMELCLLVLSGCYFIIAWNGHVIGCCCRNLVIT
eukprot:m.32822 g.32822  ORF g.32822 m.32822 type:complete len:56 (+) comp31696_c0_seq11:1755-1922(+)